MGWYLSAVVWGLLIRSEGWSRRSLQTLLIFSFYAFMTKPIFFVLVINFSFYSSLIQHLYILDSPLSFFVMPIFKIPKDHHLQVILLLLLKNSHFYFPKQLLWVFQQKILQQATFYYSLSPNMCVPKYFSIVSSTLVDILPWDLSSFTFFISVKKGSLVAEMEKSQTKDIVSKPCCGRETKIIYMHFFGKQNYFRYFNI